MGRAFHGFSTLLCTPSSLAQDVGLALGTQAGPARIREVATAAGFGRFRGRHRADDTRGNHVSNSRGTGSRSRRALGRRLAAVIGGAASAVLLATPAAAVPPQERACLGEDIRDYAQGGATSGRFVPAAAGSNGIRTEIQAHLAGRIPDAVMPNSCDD